MLENPQNIVQISHIFQLAKDDESHLYAAKNSPSRMMDEAAVKAGRTSRKNRDANVPVHNGDPTIELPAVRPDEINPVGLEVFCRFEEEFPIDEIQFSYGASGMMAATFAMRFPQGELPRLFAHPMQSDEREIFPDSHEYHIRTMQLDTLIGDCLKQGYVHYGSAHKVASPESEVSIESIAPLNVGLAFDAAAILERARTILPRGIQKPFGR